MTIITKKSLVAAGILSALITANVAMAADVPAGVQLADKQTLVRNNGAEVQSLDPHKIEGVPESNVNRDLFEGLVIGDLNGHPVRALPNRGITKILKSGLSIFAKMPNGLMARRLPRKISFIAGSVWPTRKQHHRTPAISSTAMSPTSMRLLPAKNQQPISASKRSTTKPLKSP